AEDGIRDRNVTGVQTCALPILSRLQGGSNTSSTSTLSTLGTKLTRVSTSPTSTGPMPQVGAVRVMLICTMFLPSRCTTLRLYTKIGRASCRERGDVTAGAGALI